MAKSGVIKNTVNFMNDAILMKIHLMHTSDSMFLRPVLVHLHQTTTMTMRRTTDPAMAMMP